jgi:hypothetical protein
MMWMRRSRGWRRFCHAGDWCRLREVLGVPVCFKVRVDLAVDHEHTGRARDPGLDRSEISKRAHRRGAGAVAARDRGRNWVGRALHLHADSVRTDIPRVLARGPLRVILDAPGLSACTSAYRPIAVDWLQPKLKRRATSGNKKSVAIGDKRARARTCSRGVQSAPNLGPRPVSWRAT